MQNCPKCGARVEEGRFCGTCGAPLPQPPAPSQAPGFRPQQPPYGHAPGGPPQQPPPYGQAPRMGPGGPYPQGQYPPKAKSGMRVFVIALVVTVVVAGGLIALGALFGDDPAINNPVAQGDLKLQEAAAGTLPAPPSHLFARGPYLAVGANNAATLYVSDDSGGFTPLVEVTNPDGGDLVNLALGDMYNTGTMVMLVVYENGFIIAGENGETFPSDAPVEDAFIGDFDADGQQEVLFLGPLDGETEYAMVRYQGGEIETSASATGTYLNLHPTQLHVDGKDLLMGYDMSSEKLIFGLYEINPGETPTFWSSYSVPVSADRLAYWGAGAGLGSGPVLAYTREGANPTVSLWSVQGPDSSTFLGEAPLEGPGGHAVAIGAFTSDSPQLLVVDQTGKYAVYDVK